MITNRLGGRRTVASLVVLAGLALAVRRVAANAPAGQYTITNAGTTEGIVLDKRTGLAWQQAAPTGTFTPMQATEYCANHTSLPGSGWRLPSLPELQSIVDDSRHSPAIDPNAFPATPVGPFLTSSPYVPTAGGTWGVNFADGVTGFVTAMETGFVRCVR